MKKYSLLLSYFFKDESGQDLIEYALVAAVISLGSVAALGPLATELISMFSSITAGLTAAV